MNHFKVEDWDTQDCASAREALELVETFKPDIIISDISMPQMTGLQMLEILENKSSNIPLIFITGYSDVQKITEAWNLGAFDLVDKPFKINRLLTIAEHALEFGKDYLHSARTRRLRLLKGA